MSTEIIWVYPRKVIADGVPVTTAWEEYLEYADGTAIARQTKHVKNGEISRETRRFKNIAELWDAKINCDMRWGKWR